MAERLALIFSGLSQALAAETTWPGWLAASGREWPLWLPATQLAAESQWPELSTIVTSMAEVPAGSRQRRQLAFESLVAGNGNPPILFYESLNLDGRLIGPRTQAVGALYRQAGLELDGAELPDHAAVELEFLAYMAEQEVADGKRKGEWRTIRRLFVRQHAGRWLPDIGNRLSKSTDPAWKVIGQLLRVILSPPRKGRRVKATGLGLPAMTMAESCNLCGFCAQVCPTRALWITETAQTTNLWLASDLCIRCRQCERVCEAKTLTLRNSQPAPSATATLLRQSSRVICPGCKTPTVSQAELDAVAFRLGHHPSWLDYCLDCRAMAF